MDSQKIADELIDLLASNGVEVRKELLGGNGGGLCAFKGEIFFIWIPNPVNLT